MVETLTKEQINEILVRHRKWLRLEPGGERAVFPNADFRDVDFQDADLTNSNFQGVNFQGAKLRGANFRDANLQGADLTDADLRSCITHKARIDFPIYNFHAGRDLAVATPDWLAIGCEKHPWETWTENFTTGLGWGEGYTEKQIEDYWKLINFYRELLKHD
jgi:hypothetical protein